MRVVEALAQHRPPPFADPHLATAIINRHITRFGPWFPCTAEGSLAFLTRTGRKYTLVRAFAESPKSGADAGHGEGLPADGLGDASLSDAPPAEKTASANPTAASP